MDHELSVHKVPETQAGGTTRITDLAVAKVAAAAARATSGVYSLGLGTSRALGALRGAVGSSQDPAHGVNVQVGTRQVAIDLVLTATYGVRLHDLADSVREAVFNAVQELTDFEVIEVNVEIGDVHIPASASGSEKQRDATAEGTA